MRRIVLLECQICNARLGCSHSAGISEGKGIRRLDIFKIIEYPFEGTGIQTTAQITPAKRVEECIYVQQTNLKIYSSLKRGPTGVANGDWRCGQGITWLSPHSFWSKYLFHNFEQRRKILLIDAENFDWEGGVCQTSADSHSSRTRKDLPMVLLWTLQKSGSFWNNFFL